MTYNDLFSFPFLISSVNSLGLLRHRYLISLLHPLLIFLLLLLFILPPFPQAPAFKSKRDEVDCSTVCPSVHLNDQINTECASGKWAPNYIKQGECECLSEYKCCEDACPAVDKYSCWGDGQAQKGKREVSLYLVLDNPFYTNRFYDEVLLQCCNGLQWLQIHSFSHPTCRPSRPFGQRPRRGR